MKKLTINVTDEQNDSLERMSEDVGVTKNGLICLAVWDMLLERGYVVSPAPPVVPGS